MNILIAEDNLTNLKLLRAVLEAEGHAVIAAGNGLEALAALKRDRIDAIISDILMPQMDGYRFCYEVRHHPDWKVLPFLFYTATYTSPSDEKLALDLGADGYLGKPAPAEAILGKLAQAVTLKERHRPRIDMQEADMLKEYSERLVSKLEQKNIELQQAHDEILKLNGDLERRVAERTAELAAANKELEAFSHSVSHDLRAPLRAINGFIRLFQKEHAAQLTAVANQKLERIRGTAVQMGRLVDGLLDFSSLNWMPVTKKKVFPANIVRAVFEELSPEIAGRRVEIEVAKLPACEADENLLKQVFTNLLSNAVKYSRDRDPAMIKAGWRQEQGETVYFVQDNGAGFDMKYAGRLFGVFQRLHRNDEFEGVGVGLSIVQRIIQRHGGRIWAESVPGQGATFWFTLEPAVSTAA